MPVIEPKIINNVCLTTHPDGCKAMVREQVEWTKSQPMIEGPKNALREAPGREHETTVRALGPMNQASYSDSMCSKLNSNVTFGSWS